MRKKAKKLFLVNKIFPFVIITTLFFFSVFAIFSLWPWQVSFFFLQKNFAIERIKRDQEGSQKSTLEAFEASISALLEGESNVETVFGPKNEAFWKFIQEALLIPRVRTQILAALQLPQEVPLFSLSL